MAGSSLAIRIRKVIPEYEEMFEERGGVTPTDPLQFHLYHLARYWCRLVGFCRQMPKSPEACIDGELGALVAVASEYSNALIGLDRRVGAVWAEYWSRAQTMLHERPVTIEDVERTSEIFEQVLSTLEFDP